MSDDIKILIGRTLTDIDIYRASEEMRLADTEGRRYRFYHQQEGDEKVTLHDFVGNMAHLLRSPLTQAEKVTIKDTHPEDMKNGYAREGFTWTFYKLATKEGGVTLRWLGTSHGRHPADVSFAPVEA